jgi:hypothetical protein
LYFQGIRYFLEVEEHTGYSSVGWQNQKIKLKVKLGATTEDKSLVMREWYHEAIKNPNRDHCGEKWGRVIGVTANDCKTHENQMGVCNRC